MNAQPAPALSPRRSRLVPQALRGAVERLPSTYWYLWIGTLINRAGGFVVPFLSLYLTEERHLSVSQAGAIVSLYGAGAMAAGPIGGQLTDRFGRRRTLLSGLLLSSTAMLALGLGQSVWQIGPLALVLGFTTDLFRPAVSAILIDVVPPKDREHAFALLYWVVNLGFSVAPLLAGAMASHGFLALFVADAVTTLLYAGVVFWKVPETLAARPKPSTGTATAAAPASHFFTPFQDRVFMVYLGLTMLLAMVFFQHQVTLPLVMRAHHATAAQYGTVMAVNGILIVLIQPFTSRLLRGMRRSRKLLLAAVLVAIGFGMVALIRTVPLYGLSVAIWTLGEIVLSPISATVVTDVAPADARGRYQGAYFAAWGVAAFAAPVVGATVLERFGEPVLWGGCLALALGVGLAHLAIAPARARSLARRHGHPEPLPE